MSNENANSAAFPSTAIHDVYAGLTKREYFAAMAKTPDCVIQEEFNMWKGDGNKLPPPGSQDFYKMMKAIANLEAAYQIHKADALLTQLSQSK